MEPAHVKQQLEAGASPQLPKQAVTPSIPPSRVLVVQSEDPALVRVLVVQSEDPALVLGKDHKPKKDPALVLEELIRKYPGYKKIWTEATYLVVFENEILSAQALEGLRSDNSENASEVSFAAQQQIQYVPMPQVPPSSTLLVRSVVPVWGLERLFRIYAGYKKMWKVNKTYLVEFETEVLSTLAENNLQRLSALEVSFADKQKIKHIEDRRRRDLECWMKYVFMTAEVSEYENFENYKRFIPSSLQIWYNKDDLSLRRCFDGLLNSQNREAIIGCRRYLLRRAARRSQLSDQQQDCRRNHSLSPGLAPRLDQSPGLSEVYSDSDNPSPTQRKDRSRSRSLSPNRIRGPVDWDDPGYNTADSDKPPATDLPEYTDSDLLKFLVSYDPSSKKLPRRTLSLSPTAMHRRSPQTREELLQDSRELQEICVGQKKKGISRKRNRDSGSDSVNKSASGTGDVTKSKYKNSDSDDLSSTDSSSSMDSYDPSSTQRKTKRRKVEEAT